MITVLDYNLFAGNSFRLPVYQDTIQANAAYTLDSCGKMIYTYKGNLIWFRACNPKRWLQVGTGSVSAIDSLKRSSDSIFGRKNGVFVFQYKDSVGSGGSGVTSISQGYGISASPNPITTTGTITIDSVTLDSRYLQIKDTASMLSPYLKAIDTMSLSDRIDLKLNISDTAAMLSPYLKAIDTIGLSNRIDGKIDSIARYSDSIYAYKNGQWVFQYIDSTGAANQNLQSVTDVGNNTTNGINIENNNINVHATGDIYNPNSKQVDINIGYVKSSPSPSPFFKPGIEVYDSASSNYFKVETDQLGNISTVTTGNIEGNNIISYNYLTGQYVWAVNAVNNVSNIGVDNNYNWTSLLDSNKMVFKWTNAYSTKVNSIYLKSQLNTWLNKDIQNYYYLPFRDTALSYDTLSTLADLRTKVDSINKSTDTVYYWKNGIKYFSFIDQSGGGQNGRFGNDTATIVMSKVHNDSGGPLTNGTVVYLDGSGTSSDVPSVKKANNKADSTSANTFGFVKGTIANNDTGYIVLLGKIEKLNTSAFSNGDIIYLDSISGQWTKSKPKAPYHMVYLGVVVKANAGNGSIYVKVQNGYELDEIHDVQINNIQNNQILVYSDTQKLWKNRNASAVAVTSVATGNGLSGGTITSTGTLTADTSILSTKNWRQKGVDSLQANINLKLNISDTATMLSPYLRKADTTSLSNRINLKLNISDTATMLSPYLKSSTAASTYTPQSRTITINGTTQDLTANRTYSVGTVTSVATGNGLSGGTITSSGTLTADTSILSTKKWRQKGVDSLQANINLKQDILTNPVTGTGTSGSLTKFNGTSSVTNAVADVDYLQQDMSLVAMQAMGSNIKCYNVGIPNPANINTGSNLNSQQIRFSAVYIPKSATITGITWYQSVNGNYIAGANYNGVGLYSVSGGTLTLVASSTSDTSCFKQGTGFITKAFSSTYAATGGTIMYAAILYNSSSQTTAPSLGCFTGITNINSSLNYTNNNRNSALLSSQTALPSSQALSGTTLNSNMFGIYLY